MELADTLRLFAKADILSLKLNQADTHLAKDDVEITVANGRQGSSIAIIPREVMQELLNSGAIDIAAGVVRDRAEGALNKWGISVNDLPE
jgi:hypothetical protein